MEILWTSVEIITRLPLQPGWLDKLPEAGHAEVGPFATHVKLYFIAERSLGLTPLLASPYASAQPFIDSHYMLHSHHLLCTWRILCSKEQK